MSEWFVKSINGLKLMTSYLISTSVKKPVVYGMPSAVSVELTNFCNLRCPECNSGSGLMKREKGFMDPDLFKKLISELDPFLFYVSLYFQGESMIHPQFFSFIGSLGRARSILSTNGHFLTPGNSEKLARSNLYKLIISIDGMDQETYSQYRRNGDLNNVKEGIRNLSRACRKFNSHMRVELQFLVNRMNEHQISEAETFAREVNFKLKLKSMQVISISDAGNWMPSEAKYARYELQTGEYQIKNKLPGRCLRLWFNPVITWDGKVLPCCFDKDAELVMGDIGMDSFRNIWNSRAYREFRKRVISGRETIPICRNCTSGMRGVKI